MDLIKFLKETSYPGRGIVVGKDVAVPRTAATAYSR